MTRHAGCTEPSRWYNLTTPGEEVGYQTELWRMVFASFSGYRVLKVIKWCTLLALQTASKSRTPLPSQHVAAVSQRHGAVRQSVHLVCTERV